MSAIKSALRAGIVICVVAISVAVVPAAGANELAPIPYDDIGAYSPLLIGETHGSNEVVGFIKTLVANTRDNQHLQILLEMPADMNAAIQRYFANELTVKQLLSHPFWTRKIQDGRSSAAVFGLITFVKELRSIARKVTIAGFDARRDEHRKDAPREIIMADNIRRYITQNDKAITIIITGRVHANRSLHISDDYKTVAAQLALTHQLTTLNMVARTGSYWACFRHPTKTFDCGKKDIKAAVTEDYADYTTSGMYIKQQAVDAFDGILFFDKISSSAPATQTPESLSAH
ncbi:ChaN family lipoprotein [Salinimonas sp. HHU 13199]|uniref:ChaN family lipoprotein n=1 Tax=Salinimonas profundi TaxID=2729140 RepID=A0ABR8LJM0_9ALTE|nr:hypothetical protein [Salinimonas profundi]MBD3585291.1 ChaN family lipoprotein [Salinimonas profundi]